MLKKEKNIALLIDGDNAQPILIDEVLTEVSKHGQVTIKRIYGDWSRRNMSGWKKMINKYAINAIQQFAFTKRKNATDTALIIDAMDILHGKSVDGFCLVSSDSDFTGLANRIREEGVFVMGIGQEKTPESFVKACELFIFTENLSNEKNKSEATKETTTKKSPHSSSTKTKKVTAKKKDIPIGLLKAAYKTVVQENEMAYLSDIGNAIRKIDSSFDPRTYGYSLLSKLFKSLPNHFDVIYDKKTDATFVKIKE